VTETLQEEIIRLNPKMKWNWRKTKKSIKKRAASLIPHVSYALGCRGHPGLVIERNYWPDWSLRDLYGSDVVIKSLVDGIEESCSIYSCAPQALSKEEAFRRAEEIRTVHDFDQSVRYGYPVEQVKGWCQDWINQGVLYYVLHDQEGHVVRSAQAFTKEDAEADIARTLRLAAEGWIKDPGNPRMVDMLTYPASITSFEVSVP
jgi:hypothetical protein